MEFMSDEEFNRVMDGFDWDAPINETQGEQKLPASCSPSTAEASRILPCPMTPDSSHDLSASEPGTRVKSPEDPFGTAISTDYTKRKTTNDIYVLPAEIYYDPEHCIFWDDRDFDWTRPPRLSGYRQPGLHRDNIKPGGSSTKETLNGTREENHATVEETESPNDKSPYECLTISDSNQTGPIESESGGTDLSLPGDIRPNPPGTFKPLDVYASTNRLETSSETLAQQGNEIRTDVAASKDHTSAAEQGNNHTTDATVSEDPIDATEQDGGIITNVLASTDHACPLQQGGRIAADVDISKDCNRAIDQDWEIIANVPALNDRADSTPQSDGIIIDMTVSNDCESTADKGNEIITGVFASTDHASPQDQSNGIADNMDLSQKYERGIHQHGETITNVPTLKDRVKSIEQGEGINTNASVSKDFESTIGQGLVNGQHEATASGAAVAQESVEMHGIEDASIVDSTETRLMAVAPKRPQRLFSSAVSLSSIPVRGSVKTRKTVNPFATWQPPNSGNLSDILEPPSGMPQDIGKSSNIGETIAAVPASATRSNPAGPSESASEAQPSSASDYPFLRESSVHSSEDARSTHSPPPMNVFTRETENGGSLEVPYESQAISTVDASPPAEHSIEPLDGIDLTKSIYIPSASIDEEASINDIEIEDQGEESSCDEKHDSTEEHPAKSNILVDLTHLSSTSDASTPTTDCFPSPEAIYEALSSPITNACAVEPCTKPGAVQEVESFSRPDVQLPPKSLLDAQPSFDPVSFADNHPPVDAPGAGHESDSHSEAKLTHPITPQGSPYKAQSSSARKIPVAAKDPVGPQKSVRRTQSSFVQFVCAPTKEPVSSLQAAEAEEAQPSASAEATIPVHDHIDALRASHEGQALTAPETGLITEKHVEIVEAAHERSEALTIRSSEPAEDSGAPLEAAQEVKEHRSGPDEEVSLVESNNRSIELFEPSKPQLEVVVPSPGETLTPPDSRRSSLRSRTPLKQSFQEPVSSLQEPTISIEEPGRIKGNIDAARAKLDHTVPKKTPKDKSRARSTSTTDRNTRSNMKETSTHPKSSILPAQTAQLPDDDSALQVKQAKALPGGDDISSLTQPQANGNDTRLVGPEKASQAELSSEYYDELAMSDPEDSCCTPLAVQLTPQRKHQVHDSKSSPSVKSGRCRKATQPTDTALSAKARKRGKTGPQGRKLVGDRELGGLLMRQDTPDTKVKRIDRKTEVNKLVKKAIDELESSNCKVTEDAPEKGAGKAGSEKTSSRKRGRNKSLDLTSDKKVIEKKPRRSGRLSDGVDTTPDVKVAKIDEPRRSGRLVDGTMN